MDTLKGTSKVYKRMDRLIIDAFIRVVEKIPFEKITVQQILDEAMISRHTFYVHFCDKYEVAEQIQEEMYGKFLDFFQLEIPEVGTRLITADVEHNHISHKILAYMREHERKLKILRMIHTERVDYYGRIRDFMIDFYMASYPKRENKRLDAEIYANQCAAIMNYYFSDHRWLQDVNISRIIMDSYINATLSAIGITDDSDVEKVKQYIQSMRR